MTSDGLRVALNALHWSQRGLARILDLDERRVRRWAAGEPIPLAIARWLEIRARHAELNPPPEREMR